MPGDALPAGRPAASAGPARQRCLPATPTGCYKRPRRGIVTNALVTSNFVGSRDQARCHVSAKRQGGAPQALRGRRAGRAGRARGEDGVGAHDPRHARHFPAAGMRRAARARVGHVRAGAAHTSEVGATLLSRAGRVLELLVAAALLHDSSGAARLANIMGQRVLQLETRCAAPCVCPRARARLPAGGAAAARIGCARRRLRPCATDWSSTRPGVELFIFLCIVLFIMAACPLLSIIIHRQVRLPPAMCCRSRRTPIQRHAAPTHCALCVD